MLHHLRVCRDLECPLMSAVAACYACDLFKPHGAPQMVKVVRYFITEIYSRLIDRYPHDGYVRMLYFNFIYEVQERSCQALVEMRKTPRNSLSYANQYSVYRTK